MYPTEVQSIHPAEPIHLEFQPPSRGLRPGYSETFPFPLRYVGGETPIAFFDSDPHGQHAGDPLLCIHGLGSNFTHWEHVAAGLSRRHRVIGLDLPGCGDSAKLPVDRKLRYSIRMFADSCVRLLDALKIDQAVFCGHSMGGQVAAEAALAHPTRVAKLVLMDANGFNRRPLYQRLGHHLIFHERLVVPLMERFAVNLLHLCFHERNYYSERFIGQAEGRPAHPTLDEFAVMACSVAGDLVKKHFLDDIERIDQPTLVIWGDQDRLIPFDGVPEWAARFPRGRLVVVPGCGHLPLIERPEEVISALGSFLLADEEIVAIRRTGSE